MLILQLHLLWKEVPDAVLLWEYHAGWEVITSTLLEIQGAAAGRKQLILQEM